MSTKIYDGMIAVDSDPFFIRKKINEIVQPIFYAEFDRLVALAEEAATRGETWVQAMKLPPTPYEAWDYVPGSKLMVGEELFSLMKELEKDPYRNFSFADISYSVLLFENGVPGSNPLVLLFSERLGNAMREALIKSEIVRGYGYWDNTDHDDDVTDEEWAEREKAWDILDMPKQDGLSIAMADEFTTVWSQFR